LVVSAHQPIGDLLLFSEFWSKITFLAKKGAQKVEQRTELKMGENALMGTLTR
jgi:hypothetical protein